eukprot:1051181-Prymnesium_polylepis.1
MKASWEDEHCASKVLAERVGHCHLDQVDAPTPNIDHPSTTHCSHNDLAPSVRQVHPTEVQVPPRRYREAAPHVLRIDRRARAIADQSEADCVHDDAMGWCAIELKDGALPNFLERHAREGWAREIRVWVPGGEQWSRAAGVTEAPSVEDGFAFEPRCFRQPRAIRSIAAALIRPAARSRCARKQDPADELGPPRAPARHVQLALSCDAGRAISSDAETTENRLELPGKERPELQKIGLAGPPAARVDAGAL